MELECAREYIGTTEGLVDRRHAADACFERIAAAVCDMPAAAAPTKP